MSKADTDGALLDELKVANLGPNVKEFINFQLPDNISIAEQALTYMSVGGYLASIGLGRVPRAVREEVLQSHIEHLKMIMEHMGRIFNESENTP